MTILGAEAGYPSDLLMVSPYQQTLQVDATGHAANLKDGQGVPYNIGPFGLTNGLELAIYTPAFGTTRSSTSPYAKVFEETSGSWLVCFEDGGDGDFNDLVIRVTDISCAHQELADLGTTSDPVRVQYDPRFLADPTHADYLTEAAWMADAISQQANDALTDYSALYDMFGQAGDVPSHVDFELSCAPYGGGIHYVSNAATDGPSHVLFNDSWLRMQMDPYVRAMASESTPQVAGTAWADIVDHELLHTMQFAAWGNWANMDFNYLLHQGAVRFESTAQAAEDLFADVDDTVADSSPPTQDMNDQSFLNLVNQFESDHVALLQDAYHQRFSYELAGFFEYLGERFGSQVMANLEARVAEFDRRLYADQDWDPLKAVADAIGGTRADVIDSLRDFYVTLYVRRAGNATTLPPRLRILDETTIHSQPPSFGAPITGQDWGPLRANTQVPSVLHWQQPQDVELAKTAASVYEVSPDGNTAAVRVTITNTSGTNFNNTDAPRVGFAGLGGPSGDQAVVYSTSFETGPWLGYTRSYTFPAAGLSKLAVVVVAGQSDAGYRIRFESLVGAPAVSIGGVGAVSASDPAFVAWVQAEVGGVAVSALPAEAFSASIDGTAAEIAGSFHLGGDHLLSIKPGAPLSAGTHMLTITFSLGANNGSDTSPFDVTPGGAFRAAEAPGEPVAIAAVSADNTLGGGTPIHVQAVVTQAGLGVPGGMVTATITDPSAQVRSFALGDEGGEDDSAWHDGAYGAGVGGSNQPGTYTVQIDANGIDPYGIPYALTASTTVDVGPMIDGDGDGVADSVELAYGLHPLDPSDGAADLDGDGIGAATELALGSDPLNADSDGAGEPDGSEVAAGRDPLVPADDHMVGSVMIQAVAIDGRRVDVTVSSSDQMTPVHVYRDSASDSVDLGLHDGDGSSFTDGPLVAGAYAYRAMGQAQDGALSATTTSLPVMARDDATAPQAYLLVNAGSGGSNSAVVTLAFSEVTETPSLMRVADSIDTLAAATWVPYQAQASVSVESSGGPHAVYAQLQDAAGNASDVLAGSVVLDLTAPVSTAGPLPSSSLGAGIWVPYMASDDNAIVHVELWYRYRPTQSAAWSNWTRQSVAVASPVWSTFELGSGYYEYATVAVDAVGSRESLPAVGDAAIRVGPETVNDDTGNTYHGVSQATLGLDGHVYAVWSDARNSASILDVYFARRDASTSLWSLNERVDDSPASVSTPAVAVDPAGNVYVVWVDDRAGDADIWFSERSAATGTWSPSVRVNDDPVGSAQSHPAIAVSSAGEAVAIWVDGRSHNMTRIFSARLAAGASTWSANVVVSTDSRLAKAGPDVTIGTDDTAYAIWTQTKNQDSSVRFATLADGAPSWAADTLVSDSHVDEISGQIRVDAAGDLLLATGLGSTAVRARYRLAGSSTWSGPTDISSTTDALGIGLSMRSEGVAYAVWTDTYNQIYGARWDPTTHLWGTQEQLANAGSHGHTSVALDPTTAVVVSSDYGTGWDIRAYTAAVP